MQILVDWLAQVLLATWRPDLRLRELSTNLARKQECTCTPKTFLSSTKLEHAAWTPNCSVTSLQMLTLMIRITTPPPLSDLRGDPPTKTFAAKCIRLGVQSICISNTERHFVYFTKLVVRISFFTSLPGSVRERDLHESWSRMLPELLRFSSKSNLLQLIPEELKTTHYSSQYPTRCDDNVQHNEPSTSAKPSLLSEIPEEFDAFEDDDLALLGL